MPVLEEKVFPQKWLNFHTVIIYTGCELPNNPFEADIIWEGVMWFSEGKKFSVEYQCKVMTKKGKKDMWMFRCKTKKQKKTKTHNILTEVTRVGGFSKLQRLRKTRFFCPWFNQYLTTENMFIKLTWEKVLENYPFSQGASSCLLWTSEVLHLHFSSWMLEPNFILSFPKLWRTNNRPVVQIIPISIFTKCTHFLVMRNWWLKVMTVKIAFSGQVL